jgi:hypothetical protein
VLGRRGVTAWHTAAVCTGWSRPDHRIGEVGDPSSHTRNPSSFPRAGRHLPRHDRASPPKRRGAASPCGPHRHASSLPSFSFGAEPLAPSSTPPINGMSCSTRASPLHHMQLPPPPTSLLLRSLPPPSSPLSFHPRTPPSSHRHTWSSFTPPLIRFEPRRLLHRGFAKPLTGATSGRATTTNRRRVSPIATLASQLPVFGHPSPPARSSPSLRASVWRVICLGLGC